MNKLISFLIFIMLTGCTSYRSVDIHQNSGQVTPRYQTTPAISSGDCIKYTLKDGREGEMVYQSINGNMMSGHNNEHISLEQLDKLERKEISTGKTVAAGGACIAVATVAIMTIAFSGMATAMIAAL